MTRRRRLARAALGATLWYTALCAGLASASLVFTPACETLSASEATFDTALVLGAGAVPGGLDGASADRIDAAIALARDGKLGRIIASGYWGQGSPSVAEKMAARVADTLGDDFPVLAETQSRSTLENALFTRWMLGDGEVLLITSDFHLLRGWASMAWAGRLPDAICHPQSSLSPARQARWVLRETLAWGWNIPRAILWSLARLVGVEGSLPDGFLH